MTLKFVLVFGPQAVGKMTVGHELEKITQLKLFHNHMTIDLVSPFFNYSSQAGKRLVNLFRQEIFDEVSKSDMYGLIFTYVWAFDLQSDWDYVEKICDLFESRGGTVYLVELEADINARLDRNRSPHRLLHKPTKRDLEWSDRDLQTTMEKYRLNSFKGEIKRENYIKINNTNLSATEVSIMVKEYFQL
jgi:hypothetical protein